MGIRRKDKSPMSEEFHDWLDQCPVEYSWDGYKDGYSEYSFVIDKDVD